jgi:hypothetical protein
MEDYERKPREPLTEWLRRCAPLYLLELIAIANKELIRREFNKMRSEKPIAKKR